MNLYQVQLSCRALTACLNIAGDNGYHIVAFAIQPDRGTVEGSSSGKGDVLPGCRGPAGTFLVIFRHHFLYALAHIGAHVLGERAFLQNVHALLSEATQRTQVH